MTKPAFLITIDTEADNLWRRPRGITTNNSAFLPRFQELCERCQFKPTWLTTFEMARCDLFQDFGRDLLARGAGEIGMHLHAWNSPPIAPLTGDDYRRQPYLIEYPTQVIRDKVNTLTDLLEDTFSVKMISHRAGRWALDGTYARVLLDCGYQVDCSVTPHICWQKGEGQDGDYRRAPEDPYLLSFDDVSQPGDSGLLEVPMTVRPYPRPHSMDALLSACDRVPLRIAKRLRQRLFPSVRWLRPNGRNRSEMLGLMRDAHQESRPCVEFMLHSSELMPGGSPRFPSDRSIERLYEDLEAVFEYAQQHFRGATLGEFARHWKSHQITQHASWA